MATTLTGSELKTISDLLAEMAEQFEDHGTNDYLLPANPPTQALLTATIRYNHGQDREGLDGPLTKVSGKYFIYDDWLMRYLAQRAAPGTKSLGDAEIEAIAGLLDMLARDDYHLLVDDERIAQVRYLAARCRGRKAVAPAFAGPARTPGESVATKDRPGVNERWAAQWKATLRNNKKWNETFWPEAHEEMALYVRTGKPPQSEYKLLPAKPPFAAWERLHCFPIAAVLHLWKWEREGVEEGRWDTTAASSAFLASYLAAMADNHSASLATRRRGEDAYRSTDIEAPFAALGFLIGMHERAEAVARLHLAAVRKGWFNPDLVGPTSVFILRLLADYFSEPPPPFPAPPKTPKGRVAAEPYLAKLLGAWRTPEPAALVAHLLAACDVHTHQSAGKDVEFDNGFWTRTPIAVLLVLKLRERLRLANPVIDHPLTATVVGHLPEASIAAPADESLLAAERCMRKQGFDEKKILAALRAP